MLKRSIATLFSETGGVQCFEPRCIHPCLFVCQVGGLDSHTALSNVYTVQVVVVVMGDLQ